MSFFRRKSANLDESLSSIGSFEDPCNYTDTLIKLSSVLATHQSLNVIDSALVGMNKRDQSTQTDSEPASSSVKPNSTRTSQSFLGKLKACFIQPAFLLEFFITWFLFLLFQEFILLLN